MRILLDECVDRRIKRHLAGHDVHTVHNMGWAGKSNGELLKLLLARGFEVFLTVDQNLRYQLDLQKANVAVIVMIARSNRLADLLPLMPSVNKALAGIKPGEVVEIDS